MTYYITIQTKQAIILGLIALLLLVAIFAAGVYVGANSESIQKLVGETEAVVKDSLDKAKGDTAKGSQAVVGSDTAGARTGTDTAAPTPATGDSARTADTAAVADTAATTDTIAPPPAIYDSATLASTPHGIDVSHFNGTVNWTSVRQAGNTFAFMKATEGSSIVDAMFSKNWQGARDAGIIRGAYHFFDPGVDPTAQANNFLRTVSMDSLDLPPTLDIETSGGLSSSSLISAIQTWLSVVQSKTGRTPIIYTSPGFWNSYFNSSFGNYTLWVADWGVSSPQLPKGWSTWTFWQYSESGKVSGISSAVDLDKYNGTLSQLLAFIKASRPQQATTVAAQ